MKLAKVILVSLVMIAPVFAQDNKAASYQMGIFTAVWTTADGTVTNTLHGDGTTTAGSIFQNQVAIYSLKVANGTWRLQTYTQGKDSMIRQMGMTPLHFKKEKESPLDALKGGEQVLFRTEEHRKLNGVETSVYIPFAENPNKEFRFIGEFQANEPYLHPAKARGNVQAMCDAGKLSPALTKLYCTQSSSTVDPLPNPTRNHVVPVPEAHQPPASTSFSDADRQTAASMNRLSCSQITSLILSNAQMATYLPLTVQTANERCKQ